MIGFGVLLLAVCAYGLATTSSGPQLVVPQKNLTIDDLTPGQPVTVSFVLRNTSGRPMRALGLSEC